LHRASKRRALDGYVAQRPGGARREARREMMQGALGTGPREPEVMLETLKRLLMGLRLVPLAVVCLDCPGKDG
jgi:hypothetical protein